LLKEKTWAKQVEEYVSMLSHAVALAIAKTLINEGFELPHKPKSFHLHVHYVHG
jgi:hypothetical protein